MSNIEHELRKEIAQLKLEGQYRTLMECVASNVDSVRASIDGVAYLLFCSNDYLGLTHDKRVIQAAHQGLNESGVGTGASRLISGTYNWHIRLEELIAQFKRKQAALVFSSGFLANVGIVTALTTEKSLVIIDKTNHVSIIDACRLSKATLRVYPHAKINKLAALLECAHKYDRVLVITDAIFSMDGDAALLKEIIALKKKQSNVLLMIDEAHATGVLGERGSGLAELLGVEDDVDIAMGTLSKAVGCLGGYCAASHTVIEYLKNKSRPFIYTTSLPVAICRAAHTALTIIEEDGALRKKLWDNVNYLKHQLYRIGMPVLDSQSAIIALMMKDNHQALKLSAALRDKRIIIPAIRYPTVAKGKERLRITVSAGHTKNDIDALIDVLSECKKIV